MARKEINITLQDGERSLNFKVKQMSATQLESWIIRAILALGKGGVDVPQGADIRAAGEYLSRHGLAALGRLDYEQVKPLLDELLTCCWHVTGQNSMTQLIPEVVDGILEDVCTLFKLRLEAIKLNLGFLGPEAAKHSGSPENQPGGPQ